MKNVIWLVLLMSINIYSQIKVNVGDDLVVQRNDEVTLTADIEYQRTKLDSIVELDIPIVLLDTNDLHFGDSLQYHHDIIHIVDYVHNYDRPSPFAILVQSPPKERVHSDVVISVSGVILDNGNYQRMVIKLEHVQNRDKLGENLWGHMYGDYDVNPPTTNKIVPGDYILFLTDDGTGWSLMTGITVTHDIFSDNIYYIWNTGDNTKTITVTPSENTMYSVEASKGNLIGKDNVIIRVE